MAGINPFAGKQNIVVAIVEAIHHAREEARTMPVPMARCGGLLRRGSIKQRTRLNRDRKNRVY